MQSAPRRVPRLTYRPDIDGLRAVAVLSVLFEHLRTRLTGGYIGVDVFFVISGYLISTVILSELYAGKFSIVNFYDRRIRRIIPALVVMLLGTCVLAWRYSVPSEVEAYGRTMIAALFSFSNILFWRQAGYFDEPSTLKPLLHTWSLAVEEQFYIFFPIFLILVRRWWPRLMKAAILTVTAVSFALACVTIRHHVSANFYFSPLRAWELLIGTIVSQQYLPAIEGKVARNVASAAGLLLILIPAVVYTSESLFPGYGALPPCLGAALIIAAGETGPSFVGNLLALRPVVFVGLISYSLYLWHWPILVFQNTSALLVRQPFETWQSKTAIFIVSILVATLSWRFVETPFRKGRLRPSRHRLFVIAGSAMAFVAAVGAVMIFTQGLPGRFPPQALAVAGYTNQMGRWRDKPCFVAKFEEFDPSVCLAADPGRPNYLLMGDSHAAHLSTGLTTVFPEIHFEKATSTNCRPMLVQPEEIRDPECNKLFGYVFNTYLTQHRPDLIVMAGRWEPRDFAGLEETLSWLRDHGQKVVLVGPAFDYDRQLPRILAVALRDHNLPGVAAHRLPEPQLYDQQMASLAAAKWHVPYISVYEDLCAEGPPDAPGGCPVFAAPGEPLLGDTHHFTDEGSIYFAKALRARHQMPI